MAEITAKMVKELREATGAGMMECKKALTEAEGDFEKAVDVLRTHGLAKAATKAASTLPSARTMRARVPSSRSTARPTSSHLPTSSRTTATPSRVPSSITIPPPSTSSSRASTRARKSAMR